jgi:hypothetical protein
VIDGEKQISISIFLLINLHKNPLSMTKSEYYDLNCERVKLNAHVQFCQACMEKDARIKSLEMQVKSLSRYVIHCVGFSLILTFFILQ